MWELPAQRLSTYSYHLIQDFTDPGSALKYDEPPDDLTEEPFDAPNQSSFFRLALGRSVAAAENRANEAESILGCIVSHLNNY